MTNKELIERSKKVLFQNYRTQPIALVRGEGTTVYDADGKRYLDFIGGIATVSVGHANARVREAVVEQTRLLWHASNLYVTEPQIRLAEKLVRHARTLKRVFFCNSGAEANEAAIKLARHHHVVNGHPERIEIVCMKNSFHGRTLGALALLGGGPDRDGAHGQVLRLRPLRPRARRADAREGHRGWPASRGLAGPGGDRAGVHAGHTCQYLRRQSGHDRRSLGGGRHAGRRVARRSAGDGRTPRCPAPGASRVVAAR